MEMGTEGWSGESIQLKKWRKESPGFEKSGRMIQAGLWIHRRYKTEQSKINSHLQEQDYGDRGRSRESESPFQSM